MRFGVNISMLLRVLAVSLISATCLYLWPGIMLGSMAWGASRLAEWSSPMLSQIVSEVDHTDLRFSGIVSIDMVLYSGEALSPMRTSWRASGGRYSVLGVIVFAVWAAPSGRRRWIALPGAVAALILIGSIDLSLEMQRTLLKAIGYEWIPTLDFADLDLNRETFASLHNRYRVLEWITSFQNGGGLMFAGVLAGWIGYALPGFTQFRHAGSAAEATTIVSQTSKSELIHHRRGQLLRARRI